MAETWKYMQSRKKAVADRMATMIYILWLEERINAGAFKMFSRQQAQSFFYDPLKRAALTKCSWIGASRGQIDEMKETQSAILRIKAGLSTFEMECARLGEDFRRIFLQRAKEDKLMKKLGISFDDGAEKPGANDRQQTLRSSKREEEDDEL